MYHEITDYVMFCFLGKEMVYIGTGTCADLFYGGVELNSNEIKCKKKCLADPDCTFMAFGFKKQNAGKKYCFIYHGKECLGMKDYDDADYQYDVFRKSRCFFLIRQTIPAFLM